MTSKKLKIAIYSGVVPSTTFIERLIIALSSKGHQVYLFGNLKKKTTYNARVCVITYKNGKFFKALHLLRFTLLLMLFKWREKVKLDKLIQSRSKNIMYTKTKYYPVLWHKPDVFHLQWVKGIEDWAWVQEFGIKLIVSLRGAHINYSPIADLKLAAIYKTHFPKIDAFHAVSKAIALEAEKYGAQKESIIVVYSGINVNNFKVINKAKNTAFKIISVGRNHWVKGYTYALDACRILKDKNIDFEYTIIGALKDIELVYQIHDLGLEAHVTLLDNLPFNKVQAYIKNSDLLLLPSIKEGVANVVLEAMANKTIVLATDCGGLNEVIDDGVNGFLSPNRDSNKMAEKIITITKLPLEQKDMLKKEALNTIKNHHNEAQMVDGMLELYQNNLV